MQLTFELPKTEAVPFPIAPPLANIEGTALHTSVIMKDGLPLLGLAIMEKVGYGALVDCQNKIAELADAA